jgi:proteasome lid subunit RPN8/RPN11
MRLTRDQWKLMCAHLSSVLPEEGCGLLAGTAGMPRLIVPVTNELHSPVRFRMDPQEQLNAFLQFEEAGLDLIGIYHSHPRGPAFPSATDVAEFSYPDVETLIWSPQRAGWGARAFIIKNSTVLEQMLLILPDLGFAS